MPSTLHVLRLCKSIIVECPHYSAATMSGALATERGNVLAVFGKAGVKSRRVHLPAACTTELTLYRYLNANKNIPFLLSPYAPCWFKANTFYTVILNGDGCGTLYTTRYSAPNRHPRICQGESTDSNFTAAGGIEAGGGQRAVHRGASEDTRLQRHEICVVIPAVELPKTYADATNLAAQYPALASDILSSPLASVSGAGFPDPERNIRSPPPTSKTKDPSTPNLPQHTHDRPNWALAPEKPARKSSRDAPQKLRKAVEAREDAHVARPRGRKEKGATEDGENVPPPRKDTPPHQRGGAILAPSDPTRGRGRTRGGRTTRRGADVNADAMTPVCSRGPSTSMDPAEKPKAGRSRRSRSRSRARTKKAPALPASRSSKQVVHAIDEDIEMLDDEHEEQHSKTLEGDALVAGCEVAAVMKRAETNERPEVKRAFPISYASHTQGVIIATHSEPDDLLTSLATIPSVPSTCRESMSDLEQGQLRTMPLPPYASHTQGLGAAASTQEDLIAGPSPSKSSSLALPDKIDSERAPTPTAASQTLKSATSQKENLASATIVSSGSRSRLRTKEYFQRRMRERSVDVPKQSRRRKSVDVSASDTARAPAEEANLPPSRSKRGLPASHSKVKLTATRSTAEVPASRSKTDVSASRSKGDLTASRSRKNNCSQTANAGAQQEAQGSSTAVVSRENTQAEVRHVASTKLPHQEASGNVERPAQLSDTSVSSISSTPHTSVCRGGDPYLFGPDGSPFDPNATSSPRASLTSVLSSIPTRSDTRSNAHSTSFGSATQGPASASLSTPPISQSRDAREIAYAFARNQAHMQALEAQCQLLLQAQMYQNAVDNDGIDMSGGLSGGVALGMRGGGTGRGRTVSARMQNRNAAYAKPTEHVVFSPRGREQGFPRGQGRGAGQRHSGMVPPSQQGWSAGWGQRGEVVSEVGWGWGAGGVGLGLEVAGKP
ncbi:hypothetical protein BV25DRAFT_18809 [Artomyces pyxidatus]|uniref:Uncharacterized protein n=1 Tax=Artomyces pyxidatus TaxID=48021 RepID=A0ACB8TJP0_9AGAM|nr:hypothetical protein BV25DRAFT_18809 [Artomyces pyxidatus]